MDNSNPELFRLKHTFEACAESCCSAVEEPTIPTLRMIEPGSTDGSVCRRTLAIDESFSSAHFEVE